MTLQDFVAKYTNVLVDYDKFYGGQCVDLFRQYLKEVLKVPQPRPILGAADLWDVIDTATFERISNSLTNIPQPGDIMIWKKSRALPFGHVGIVHSANVMRFTSFDQNFPVGTRCHLQTHYYLGSYPVLGWLRLKPKKAGDDVLEMKIRDALDRGESPYDRISRIRAILSE